MRSLWHRNLLRLFTPGAPSRQHTDPDLELRLLDRRSVLLMFASIAAAPVASARGVLGGRSARPLFQAPPLPELIPGKFRDITSEVGIDFRYLPSHTTKKYLIETMGTGVALFDFDNDGRLDIFLVNGAPLSDPTSRTAIPQ